MCGPSCCCISTKPFEQASTAGAGRTWPTEECLALLGLQAWLAHSSLSVYTGSCQEEQGLSFYEDTQFITKPVATRNLLDIRPDTECLGGLVPHQDTGLMSGSMLSAAAKMQDDCQPTAMSCVGRQAATPQIVAALSKGLQRQNMGLPLASCRGLSAATLEQEVSGESDSP